jgi:glycosyltransferase involved in cell wall biosynthesis
MRVLIATDAWRPQVNGVVRTYERLALEGPRLGVEFEFLCPEPFPTLPLPTYPEIRLAVVGEWNFEAAYNRFRPDYIHIATEGPIGLATRSWCVRKGHPFTSAYHTRFPDYVSARVPVPLSWGYALQRWFHNSGAGVMVAAPSLQRDLKAMGFQRLMPWTRGVDTELFRPRPELRAVGGSAPVFLYVGRIAVEKGVEQFLSLDLPGSKVVVGDGPQLEDLRRKYPTVRFTGPKTSEELAREYAAADVFVFPSRTDTFGIVLVEAMASGLPVAALPVTGPIDIVRDGESGVLDNDLRAAAMRALELDRDVVRQQSLKFSWAQCAQMFIDNVIEANRTAGHRPKSRGRAIALGA